MVFAFFFQFYLLQWLQLDSNPQPLGQTSQMIELCCEYLSVWCIWLYVLVMSRTRFRVNPHSIVSWMSRNSLLKAGVKSEVSVTATGLEPIGVAWGRVNLFACLFLRINCEQFFSSKFSKSHAFYMHLHMCPVCSHASCILRSLCISYYVFIYLLYSVSFVSFVASYLYLLFCSPHPLCPA